MALLATIATPEYNNVIAVNPSGSAYAYSASTGVLDANFAAIIGTTDSIQIVTQGYQFAWKPDTVNVLDNAGNLTLLDTVNANAAAQVWNNKVTYVGTTAATSDEFVVDGNQLKHSVSMVAPPTLPGGFTNTLEFLAIGGDIGTTAQDWSDIDLWADGTTHTADFVTSDDLSFRKKVDGKEVYRIPHISITDDAGNGTSGQYKLVFGTNNTVTLYMLCPWEWMQKAQYPVIIDPTVIVSSGYDVSGTGGRKLVKLSNGWIVTCMLDTSGYVRWYYSQDSGTTWAALAVQSIQTSLAGQISLASNGTVVYTLASSTTYVYFYSFDAATIIPGSAPAVNTTMASGGRVGEGTSIAVDGSGNVHAVWSVRSGGAATPFILQYNKGAASGTTVTWGTATSLTSTNAQMPTLALNANGNPAIAYVSSSGSAGPIYTTYWNGSAWTTAVEVTTDTTATSPSVAYDSNGTLWLVWQSTGSNTYHNIVYGKSTDNGSTWTAGTVFASTGTSNDSYAPSITVNMSTNDLYVFWAYGTYNVAYMKYTASNATWGSSVTVYTGSSGSTAYVGTLWSQFNMNSSNSVQALFSGDGSNVEYYYLQLDSPPNAPILNTVSGFDATVAQTLSWTFSDPDTGDTQSAYQLQIVDTSSGSTVVDTGKVAQATTTNNQTGTYNLAANTLTNGKQYQWRVVTWDSSGAEGSWSSYSTFKTAAAPNVTLTTPVSGGTVNSSSLTVQWSYSDPGNNAEQSYQLQLLDSTDATVLWDSGTVTSSGLSRTVGYSLANNTNYHIRVRATNSQGIMSSWADNTFSVSYTPPETPTIAVTPDNANAKITIAITNPTPGSGQPEVTYNDLYRRETGTASWTRIATQLANNATYVDYTAQSGQSYDYYVNALGSNTTNTPSTTVSTSVSFAGLWIHDVNNPSGTILNLLYQQKPKDESWQPAATTLQFAGRTRPIVEFGEQEDYTLNATVTMTTPDGNWALLESLVRTKDTVCVRDGRGRKVFGVVLDLKETDEVYGQTADLTVTEIDYSETV